MPTRPARNPPKASTSKSGFAPDPSNPSSLSPSEISLRRPLQPQNDPTMPTLNGSSPTSPYRRGHHRSISHPFPFASLGKKREKAAPKQANWDSDSDSDVVTYPDEVLATSPRKDVPKGGSASEYTEGKCQTCNSTVRWPRHVQTYRCTTCLMVTDLDVEPPKKTKDPAGLDLKDRPQKPLPPNPPEDQLPSLPYETISGMFLMILPFSWKLAKTVQTHHCR